MKKVTSRQKRARERRREYFKNVIIPSVVFTAIAGIIIFTLF